MKAYLKPCSCGNEDEEGWPVFDARGIFCFYSCTKCDKEKRSKMRPEIFTDSQYEADDL
jgi:hypothetical protein